MRREDIEFTGPGGATLRGWFFPADTANPSPCSSTGSRAGHFDAYTGTPFEQSSAAAADWFSTHLLAADRVGGG